MVLGNGLGLYLIHLGRTNQSKDDSELTRKVVKKGSEESKSRDEGLKETLDTGISDILSAIELKKYYTDKISTNSANSNANTEQIGLAQKSIDRIIEQLSTITNDESNYRDKALKLFGQKKIDEAIALMEGEEASKAEETYIEDIKLRIDLYFANLEITKAIPLIDKVTSHNPTSEKYVSYGSMLLQLNLLNKALEYLDKGKIIAQEENNPKLLRSIYSLSSIAKMKSGRNEEGYQDLVTSQTIKSIDKSQYHKIDTIGEIINQGMYHYNKKDLVNAEIQFNNAKNQLAAIYDRTELHHVRTHCTINQNLANVERELNGNLTAAAELNESCLREIQSNPEFMKDPVFFDHLLNYHFIIATIESEKNNYEEAIISYKKILKVLPILSKYKPQALEQTKAQTLHVIGNCYYKLNSDEAVDYLTRSLELYQELNSTDNMRFMPHIFSVSRDLSRAKSRR